MDALCQDHLTGRTDVAEIVHRFHVVEEYRVITACEPLHQFGHLRACPDLLRKREPVISGKVTRISADALVQNGQFSGYYLVECSIANTVLTDKDGNNGAVVIGMQVEAKIVTQRKTIIRYLFEKTNLF